MSAAATVAAAVVGAAAVVEVVRIVNVCRYQLRHTRLRHRASLRTGAAKWQTRSSLQWSQTADVTDANCALIAQ